MEYFLFYTVIFIANIIQGITGFAGTILAMPFGIILVGYDTAKPILNVLGLLAGVYIFLGNRDKVAWVEVKKIIIIMLIGIFLGLFLKNIFIGSNEILYKILGLFVIYVAINGLVSTFSNRKNEVNDNDSKKPYIVLAIAGLAHGLFVAGGPLLISYLTKRVTDKTTFRATISTVWIILNTIILIDDIRFGLWNSELVIKLFISIPFMLCGMFIGGLLYSRMSQPLFMKITYILLLISGTTLILK